MTFTIQILSVFKSNWLLYLCLGVVLLIQLGLLWHSRSLPKKRLWIRLGLNLFVGLTVFLFIFQPGFNRTADSNKVLLTDAGVPKTYIQKVKDSLQIKESFSASEFNRLITKNPHLTEQLGNVYLLGKNFNQKTISQLSNKTLNWIPYFENGQLQDISWNAIVRKGDIQEIRGKITVDEPQILRIKYANQVLDSLSLNKGMNAFHFSFPVFTIGQTEAVLTLADKPLQDIHFFANAPQARNVLFILGNPDFESKNLSEWLGKNNHKVEIITTIAKDAQSKVSINKTTQAKPFNADIVITDPSNAAHALVKKAATDGKSVMFINSINPEQDAKTINQALGTNWRVKKISNEQSINLADNLTALPYVLAENINQKSVGTYPIAVQKKVGVVGLSLINETFPLKLSGDSLNYNKIWASVFQRLNPAAQNNVIIQSPIFTNTQTPVIVNNPSSTADVLKIAGDTISITQSPVNPLTFSGNYIFRESGWQPLQDSLAVFVEDKTNHLQQSNQIQETLLVHQTFNEAQGNTSSMQTLTTTLPDWVWYLLILLGLAALWLEPKLNF